MISLMSFAALIRPIEAAQQVSVVLQHLHFRMRLAPLGPASIGPGLTQRGA